MGRTVIVGNGVAAVSAAASIREVSQSEEIIICSAEPYLAYYRTKLSNLLGTIFSPPEIFIYQPSWYEENRIEVMLGQIVKKVNLKNKEVITQNDDNVPYDTLIITTGGSPRIPRIDGLKKHGVFNLRSYEDSFKIKEYGESRQDFIIAGGGVLGLEIAGALKKWKKNVKLLVQSDQLLSRQLDPEAAGIIDGMVREQGIEVYYNSEAAEISGSHKVNGVYLKEGNLVSGEVVIFAAGIQPEVGFIEESHILGKAGIAVNENMRTKDPNVFAAGDAVEFQGMVQGRWPVAKMQGEIAGYNAAGREVSYQQIPPYNLVQTLDMQIYSVGVVSNKNVETFSSGNSSSGFFRKLFFSQGRLVGAILIGDVAYSYILKEAVSSGNDYSNLINDGTNTEEIISKMVKEYQSRNRSI